mmetsp:Transcript_3426/g.4959  ORF Transcript_3426/g.4959 Transcript_3426/m.4959 type:complete len:595 (+) Transcript_3426:303-2087(+)
MKRSDSEIYFGSTVMSDSSMAISSSPLMQNGPTIIIDRQLSEHWRNSHESSQHHDQQQSRSAFRQQQQSKSSSDLGNLQEVSPLMDESGTPIQVSVSYGTQDIYGGTGTSMTLTPTASSFVRQGSGRLAPLRSIRFQVVVWYVGPVDVVLGRVNMKFRVTVFWNDEDDTQTTNSTSNPSLSSAAGLDNDASTVASTGTTGVSKTIYTMQGRNRAVKTTLDESELAKSIEIPPISILNAVSFETIGLPDVAMLQEDTKLMRWTCLYKATLMQDNLRVDKFPHDEHDLMIKLGIMTQRRSGEKWDRHRWRLDLANEFDSQRATRIPHGVIVDHVTIPEFHYDKEQGLEFNFVPLAYGADDTSQTKRDMCLEVKLHVTRDSGYYDSNIMPLLAILNIVAICLFAYNAENFFQRALLLLNISFTEMGIRMTVDSHLPNVGYQITMQRVLNQCFFLNMGLILESSILYVAIDRYGMTIEYADIIDIITICFSLLSTVVIVASYYRDKQYHTASSSMTMGNGHGSTRAVNKTNNNMQNKKKKKKEPPTAKRNQLHQQHQHQQLIAPSSERRNILNGDSTTTSPYYGPVGGSSALHSIHVI